MGTSESVVVLDDRSLEVEVVAKATRRKYSAEYKLAVLREADTCSKPGEIGALLRREGLHSSNLVSWRRQREKGELSALSPRKRGPVPKEKNPLAAKVAALEKERIEGLMAIVVQQRDTVGIATACTELSVPRATFYRHQKPRGDLRQARRAVPRALPPKERQMVLAMLNDDRFADLPPAEVYATLLD